MMEQSVNVNVSVKGWEPILFSQNKESKLPKIEYQDMCFRDLLKIWLGNNRLKYKDSTLIKYEQLIKHHILPMLGDVALSDMNSLLINQFLLFKLENGRVDQQGGLNPSYVRSIMLIINSALNYAALEGWCATMKTPICRPVAAKNEIRIIDMKEQRQLETYIMKHLDLTGVGILLSLYAGLRIGEICALSWDDVDLENRVIFVRHTLSRVKRSNSYYLGLERPKTNSSLREIPIPSSLFSVLERIRARSDSKFVISTSDTFLNPRTFEYRYHKLLKQAGVTDINFHALRHTFATRCIQAGVDIKSLSEVLGHSNTSITLNIYVHSSMEMKREQMEKLRML